MGEPLDLPRLDLAAPRTVHVVGVGGAGMSAIALVLARMGHRVSGSDLRDGPALERLGVAGVTTHVGHDPSHVPPLADAVVVSSAVRPSNPEVVAARAAGIPVVRRAEALRALVVTRRGLAVAGTHGKTTTSSMLALVLRGAGLHPSFVIGGELNEVGTNAAYDDGEWFVVEADESDGTFLELPVEAAVVTNIEADHLEHYGGFAPLVDAFECFVARVPGPVVLNADDTHSARLAARHPRARTFGWADGAAYRIRDYRGARDGSRFVLEVDGRAVGEVHLPVLGRHNAANATAATALALELGVGFGDAVRALGRFGGVARRFEFRGRAHGVTFVDDYAHLPGEVAAIIAAAREGGWNRVIAVFQPHRYTRTASLWREFADAFRDADAVVLTDVYPAGEDPIPGVSGRLLVRAVLDAHPHLPVSYLPRRADLLDVPRRLARPGDVVLTLGAGDVTTLADEWLAAAREVEVP